MRYMVTRNYVQVIGDIWMPQTTAAMEYTVSSYDIENMKNEQGNITRDDVQAWLDTHAGDFSVITDFAASIEDTEIPWETEDSEFVYADCMYPTED